MKSAKHGEWIEEQDIIGGTYEIPCALYFYEVSRGNFNVYLSYIMACDGQPTVQVGFYSSHIRLLPKEQLRTDETFG